MRKAVAEKILSKLPSHIRITPKVSYELVEIEEFKDGKTDGETRGDIRQIVVRKLLSPQEKLSTYVHEWLHSLDLENDIVLSEKQVLGLEKAIIKSLDLNKFFDFLAKNC